MIQKQKLIELFHKKVNSIIEENIDSQNTYTHNFSSITTKKQATLNKQLLTFLMVVLVGLKAFSQPITPVNSFGSNPGNLNMYSYVPNGISGPVSLVLVLHGCTQNATDFAAQTGWNKLADKHKFIVVYPEQKKENNSILCFNWFDSLYQQKGQLQVLSIKQMVDYMKANYLIDTSKIFITGLSAGGAMSNVMLANYPETFKKGAIMAGIPFKASKDTVSAFYATYGHVTKTPEQWGGLIKNANPTYTGEYPHVAVFHGDKDSIVYFENAAETIKQWTNVNGADQTPESIDTIFQGNANVSLSIYNDTVSNKPVVYYYKIKNMKHAISIDTGSCPRQGGQVAAYAKDFDFHSTYWAADFFGIIHAPYMITGLPVVFQNATNIIYSIPNTSGSTYNWTVPTGATIVSGQGSNSITVNFGIASGNVTVEETTSNGCINDLTSEFVKVLNYNLAIYQTSFIKCYGGNNAALSAIVTGDNGPFTLNWAPIDKTTSVVSNLSAGTYTLTVRDNTSAIINTSTFTIVQPPLLTTTQSLTICARENIKVGKNKYHRSGTYIDILISSQGCDSIVNTILLVLPEKNTTQIVNKCFGESFTVGTNTYTSSGRYTDVFTTSQGCDSIVNTILILSKCPKNNSEIISTIDIYPNPLSTFATIKFSEEQNDITIKIIDWAGNQVLYTHFSGDQYQLEAENLKKGNYTVLIIDGNNKIISKHIIVK